MKPTIITHGMRKFFLWLLFHAAFITLIFHAGGFVWGTEQAGLLIGAVGGAGIIFSALVFLGEQ